MSTQKTSENLHSATSSVASADGQEPCRLQDGVQTDLFGQEVPLVSLSQAQEIKKAKTTSGISGLSSSISSESAALQRSLESRLRQQLDLGGSMIYKLTWKQKVTPQQRSYYHLGASAHRTKETGSSSWPTPSVRDYKDTGNLDKSRFRKSGKEGNDTVPRVAYGIAPWATPNTMDHLALRSDEALLKQSTTVRKGRTFPNNLREQVDPRSQEIYASGKIPPPFIAETGNLDKSRFRKSGKEGNDTVPRVAYGIAPWATPNTMDHMKQRSDEALARAKQKAGCSNLKDQIPYSGEVQKSSTAETENTVPSQLNPRFSLWLMGYPIEWAYCAERVTQSSRKRQRKS